jgi:hypothetical protein
MTGGIAAALQSCNPGWPCLSRQAYTPSRQSKTKVKIMSRYLLALLFAFSFLPAHADRMPGPDASRGEVLYAAKCGDCHNSTMHWRDKTLAKDWAGLRFWVRHWEKFNELKWSDDDITEVARYLNRLYYHYPEPVERQGSADAGTAAGR